MKNEKRSRSKEQTTNKEVESMIEKRKKDNKSGVVTVRDLMVFHILSKFSLKFGNIVIWWAQEKIY